MIAKWINEIGLPIIVILILAFLSDRFGGLFISGLIHRTVGRMKTDVSKADLRKRQDTLIGIFKAILRIIIWLTATFTVLERLGFHINLGPLLAGASFLGVAVGFGAQSIIKDVLAGFFIVVENQYRVGDVVDLDGSAGTVEQITIRTTILRDQDGNVHYIPHGGVARAINKTFGFSKVNLSINVAPETDIDQLASVINDVGQQLSHDDKWQKKILEAPHFLSIGSFTNTSLEVKIIGETQPSEQWSVAGELRKRLLLAFKKHKIASAGPVPTTTVSPAPGRKK